MSEEWRELTAFPRYEASDAGLIRYIKTGNVLHPSKNKQGHLKVNLVHDGGAYTRAVNHVIAGLFLDPPKRDDFISLIHRDGVKANCASDNLLWRPRYFAVRYHLQFETAMFHEVKMKVADNQGNKYKSIQDAVVENGLLLSEILTSIYDRTYVWPTYQEFRKI